MRVCPVCQKRYDEGVGLCPDDGARTRAEGAAPQAETETDPLIGRMVGSYRISRLLGKGGMGAVYAAEHPAIGSKVAIKFLHEQYARDKNIVTRFFNEARSVNLINHDNIVRVVDYSYLDERMPYFVMEMLGNGYELGKLAREPQPLSVSGIVLLQVCDALAAAHDNGIVHRDLKPDNVFLAERSGRAHFVKLMDFGIAKLTGGGTDAQGQTQTGMVMGTPHYMSPEQASGKSSAIDGRSDIYSLGVIMYQLATGMVPFKGDSFAETLVAHITQPPQPPRTLNPHIPAHYEQVILRCLAKNPDERFQNARELAEAIAESMRAEGCSFERPHAGTGARSSAGSDEVTITPNAVRTQTPGRGGTRVGTGTVVQGTMVVDPHQVPAPGKSAGARIVLWAACLAIGFGGVVGAVKGGLYTQQVPQVALAAGGAAAGQLPELVPVRLESHPPGAQVTLEDSGQALGEAPLVVELPRGRSVSVSFAWDGQPPHRETVVADQAKTVTATLHTAAVP